MCALLLLPHQWGGGVSSHAQFSPDSKVKGPSQAWFPGPLVLSQS